MTKDEIRTTNDQSKDADHQRSFDLEALIRELC
jgi:hypothetical protein